MNEFTVPFGKYQGYPIDILFNDKSYLYWFLCESDAIVNHRDIHREIIRRIVFQEKSYNRITPNFSNIGTKNSQFTSPLAERNQMISELISPDFDWGNFASVYFKHDTKGEVSNLVFFADKITAQFDYSNSTVDGFEDVHFLLQYNLELTDDFEFVLDSLVDVKSNHKNLKKCLIVSKVTALGISEELLIRVFALNKIHLHILAPKPKTITFSSKIGSNNSEEDFPF